MPSGATPVAAGVMALLLTAGCGAMGGAQPLAGKLAGASTLVVEVDQARIDRRDQNSQLPFRRSPGGDTPTGEIAVSLVAVDLRFVRPESLPRHRVERHVVVDRVVGEVVEEAVNAALGPTSEKFTDYGLRVLLGSRHPERPPATRFVAFATTASCHTTELIARALTTPRPTGRIHFA